MANPSFFVQNGVLSAPVRDGELTRSGQRAVAGASVGSGCGQASEGRVRTLPRCDCGLFCVWGGCHIEQKFIEALTTLLVFAQAEAGVNPQSQPLGFAPFGTLQYPLAHSQMQGVQGPAMGGSPYEQQQVMHHGHPMSLHAPSTMAGWPAYPQQVMPPFYGAYGGPVWHPQQQPQIHANGHHTIETSAVLSAQGWVQSHAGLYSDPRNAGTPHVKTTTQHLLLHDNMSPLQPVVDAQQRQVPMIQLKGEEPARAETLRRRTERVVVMDPDSGQPILINSFKSTQTPEQRAAMASRKRVYECPFCGHLFASSSNLIRHKRVHTGDRP